MARSLRYSVYVLALVGGLTFLAGLVFAQAGGALPVPVNISTGAAVPTGLQSVVTFDARNVGTAANAGYYSKPVLVSNSTLAGLGRGLLRRALPVAAMTAAVTAAGWAIDELTSQVMDGPPAVAASPPGTAYWAMNGKYFPSGAAAGQWYAGVLALSFPSLNPTFTGLTGCSAPAWNGSYSCNAKIEFSNGNVNQYGVSFFPNNNPGEVVPYSFPVHPQPVSDALLGQLVANNPALAAAAVRNPDGSVNRNPDVMAAAQALANELNNPAGPQPDPVAEWNTGQQGGEPQPAAGGGLDFPVFCEWATGLCEAITWFQDDTDDEPADAEIDWIDPEAAVTWSSGLGGGSCPADVSVDLPIGGELVFPMGQFCDAADMIRPLVIFAFAFMAALIIGGYRRAA